MTRRRVTALMPWLLAAMAAAAPAAPTLAQVRPAAAASSVRVRLPADGVVRLGRARAGGGYDVERLPLDRYIAEVLAGEAAPASPRAALEALAITARTFALANLRRHGSDGFDLCDQTHCQVARRATSATDTAARSTSGQLLVFDGDAASVYYAASCGGRTEVPSAVWRGAIDPPFLASREDDACTGDGPWTSSMTTGELVRVLRAAGLRGSRLSDFGPIGYTASGRVARLQVDGFSPGEIAAPDFRLAVIRTFGWSRLKSTAFNVERTADGYRFTGRGNGHGVGLCVIGSTRLAAAGASVDDILGRYFPGLPVVTVGGASRPALAVAPRSRPMPAVREVERAVRGAGRLRIALPAEDEGDRVPVEELADRLLSDLAHRVGRPIDETVVLRFHPTVASFRRSTGQAWWISAVTSGGVVELLPLQVLRARASLESTLRHEMAHIAVDHHLGDRPLWVREGAAIHFAGEQFGEVAGRLRCPRDSEIARAPSAGALREAYTRAGACFARAIRDGTPWTDIE